MKKTILLFFALMMAICVKAQDFTIDLTQNPVNLPTGVTQVSYPQNGVSFNGAQHGWCWFAFTFHANGPVKITLGGCQYINTGYEGYVEAAGTKIGDITNKTTACYDADPLNNVASYTYTGGEADLTVYCGQYCPMAKVETYAAPTVKEERIYFTNFQDWTAFASSATADSATFTTNKSNETLTFTFAETQIAPTGVNNKFTATCITSGYAMAAKSATPYIQTSTLASVTKVAYVHAATGSNRGWGMQVKGDGDADWVTVQDVACVQAGTAVEVEVNRTNCQIRFYNLNSSQNAYMTELAIYGNVTVQPRTFQGFEIDMTQQTLTLPTNVEQVSYAQHGAQFHDASHGWCWAAFKVAVDGPVRFTFGGCQYASETAKVRSLTKDLNGDGVINDNDSWTVDTSTPGCYHNGGTATWTYNYEQPDTLIIYCGEYCPYLKAEACEYVANITLIYFDQNNGRLGETSIAPGLPFDPAYTVNDLPAIPAGKTFRGWYKDNGTKVAEGEIISADLNVFALVTDIETATVGSHYKYDLTKNSFYMEDHELISATGKQHGSGHGFVFNNGQEMALIVSPKSYVTVGLCTYTNTSDQLVRNAAGDSVAVMSVIRNGEDNATADGALTSFYYENTSNQQDTLHFIFTTTSYIHSVEVYNVAAPLNKQGHCYHIAGGDAATLMMVCNILQDYDTVYLANGIYNLGETVLTTIGANHVALIGESMDSTIIYNTPDVLQESINNTATILNAGNYNTFESLTLQNGLDYYRNNNGRAVCLQDKGSYTACYDVRMLSYQDTYYSNKPGQKCYFENCEIHGTVDYICGSGSVYFYNTTLYCEARQSTGGGSDCITANNSQTAQGDKGYVFDRCTIKSACPTVSLSRSWNDQPMVAYLLTTLDYSEGQFSLNESGKISRWTIQGMNNVVPEDFSEYNTMDVDGNIISPESNEVTFVGAANKTMETIIGYEAAEAKSYIHFFGDWDPARNYEAFPEEEPEVTTYFVKHPWGTGADADWTWKQMEFDFEESTWWAEGLWGGVGCNINTKAEDAGAKWFATAAISFVNFDILGNITKVDEPAIGTTVTFAYSTEEDAVVVLCPIPEQSALNNTDAENQVVKFIENDHVVILKNGVRYNVLGSVIE